MKTSKNNYTFYSKIGKRILDFIVALITLVLLLPIILIVSILVKIKLGSPIFFKQARPGLDENLFYMYKFRTMTSDRDEAGNLLPDDQRLTKFGRFLRSTSIDEIPEIYNILIGDMSFVGPRPLLVSYLPYYSDEERIRHTVRPGITGLAQVSGRNAINWEEKFSQDINYCNNISFFNDVLIIFKTIKVVFFRENILVGKQHIVGRLDKERENKQNDTYKKI